MAFLFGRDDPPVIGTNDPGSYYLGTHYDFETGREGGAMYMPGSSFKSILLCGVARAGKDSGIGTYNALRFEGGSLVTFDKGGEQASIAGAHRAKVGKKFDINPYGVGTDFYPDLASDGFGSLAAIKPGDPMAFEESYALSEAWHRIEGKDPHWAKRARGFWCGASLYEINQAAKEGRPASNYNVRKLFTEPDVFDPQTGEPVKGFIANMRKLATCGDEMVEALVASGTTPNDETASVRATIDANTIALQSPNIRNDEQKSGLPLHLIGNEAVSVFFSLYPYMVREGSIHAPLCRMVMATILRSLYRPTKVGCTVYINEFQSFSKFEEVEAALGLTAGFSIRLVLVVQSLAALREIYGNGWEVFFSQAGAVIQVGAPADKFSADYLSARSGETTIRQPNAGLSINPGGIGMSEGEAYTRRPYLMPQDLYNLKPGYGYVFLPGLANPVPACFPPYWKNPTLNRRARPNPYYRG
jgi:type IV secretion system protein VirD4